TDRLYHNQGDGTFNDVTTQAGLTGTQTIGTIGATTGDINNDGYRDLFITSLLGQSNILYKNNGDGTFTDISASANIQFPASRGYSAVMGDYNQDSYLDIYVVNYGLSAIIVLDSNGQAVGYNPTGLANNLYVNNGDETFSQMAVPLNVDDSGTGLVAAFTDFDNDRDVDLLVGNDFGPWLVSQSLFRNDYPTNDFTDISAASGVINPALYAMGIAVGDYDGDMDLDYYMTSIGAHALFNNQGNNTFQDMAPFAGVVDEFSNDSNYTSGWGTVFFDYDLDTDVDLFVSKGFIGTADFIPVDPKNSNKLYQNNGNGTFADVTVAELMNDSGHARGAIYGDYDNDGDLDLVVGRASCVTNPDPGGNSRFWFYRNNAAGGNHHWVKFKLEGVASNRDAFGAHVRIYFNGQALLREVDGGSSFLSQNSSIVHFGLGTNSMLDTVVVDWPNGHTDTLYQLPADETYQLIEDSVLMVSRSQVLEL
ncbi:MAG: CRTAC1 family protein, partial [Bacteroidota bacterium]